MKDGISLSNAPHNAVPASARAEAAAWVARLHSSDRTTELESGFKNWIEADAAHAHAFESATEAWELGGSVPANRFPRIAHPGAAPRSLLAPHRLSLAAALGVVAMGAALYLARDNSEVITRIGEQRMLTLEDGSRIFLNTGTRLTVRYDKNRRSIKLSAGEAMFDVNHDAQRPFTVAAGDRAVLALGTKFLVRRETDETEVTLVEGKVAVSSREIHLAENPHPLTSMPRRSIEGQGVTILSPGQRLTFAADKPIRLDEPPIEKVTAWRRGEVVLDKTPLGDAAAEMNRYSDVKLVLEDPSAAKIALSGIFRAGDSARFADAVAETYHLHVDHRETQIVISGPRYRN